MKKLYLFVGARPNFMKAAPLCKELDRNGIGYEIYHSGQHYDTNLSSVFHEEFDLGKLIHMKCGRNGNAIHDIQQIIQRTRKILDYDRDKVRGVVVFGDVATTYSVALSAKQLGFKLAHVESGLRSFDIEMPEELTRIAVDHISDILFCPSDDAVDNLNKEGRVKDVYMVGNIMIDCLKNCMDKIEKHTCEVSCEREYILVTFHRPVNVDNEESLSLLCSELMSIALKYDVVFPVHPRTHKNLKYYGLYNRLNSHGIKLLSPLGYFDFMKLLMGSKAVVTDSGGVQEETTYLNIPCFTARTSTERPITIIQGTNKLIGLEEISSSIDNIIKPSISVIPKLWDGNTSTRIANILDNLM